MSPIVRIAPGLAPDRSIRAHHSRASGSWAALAPSRRWLIGSPQLSIIRTPVRARDLDGDALGVVVAARHAREGPVLHHRGHAVWVRRRQHRRGRAALGNPEHDYPLDAARIEHRERVVDDVLECVGAGV